MGDSILGREPVMWMAVIQAGIALAVAFGLNLSADQVALVVAFAAVVLGLISRSVVTPTWKAPLK